MRISPAQQPSLHHPCSRGPGRGVQDVPEEPGDWLPLPHHHLFSPKLPRRVRQQGYVTRVSFGAGNLITLYT